jgi:hypothetical protein
VSASTYNEARIDVTLLHRTSNWVSWSTNITSFLSLRPTPVQEILNRRPTPAIADEEEKDRVSLNHIILYIDDSLTKDEQSCKSLEKRDLSRRTYILRGITNHN